ncbi:hypothetical protein, partial [Segetibacter aerophilus]|uniref:hypothetical protein n=1 Tax=Segetibacter aerophilus TaxID=670293 RepID=UPI001C3F6697
SRCKNEAQRLELLIWDYATRISNQRVLARFLYNLMGRSNKRKRPSYKDGLFHLSNRNLFN